MYKRQGCRKLAIVASAIYLLDVVPLSQLGIDSIRTIVLHLSLIHIYVYKRQVQDTWIVIFADSEVWFIVRFPEGRSVVIDSKAVSYTHLTKKAEKDKISVEYNGSYTIDTQLAKWDDIQEIRCV